MAELSPDDVEQYTQGLLSATDSETPRMLNAALAVARSDVRWFVSPVIMGDVVTLNGNGGQLLRLPTKQVINLTSITNDGVALDPVNDVILDSESGNLLILTNGRWSNQYNGVVVTMDHGYPEDVIAAAAITGYTGPTADDWRQAILALVVNISQIAAIGRPDTELHSKQVADVVYQWGAAESLASIEPILAKYRLLWRWV
jgi:hypothetical protein